MGCFRANSPWSHAVAHLLVNIFIVYGPSEPVLQIESIVVQPCMFEQAYVPQLRELPLLNLMLKCVKVLTHFIGKVFFCNVICLAQLSHTPYVA